MATFSSTVNRSAQNEGGSTILIYPNTLNEFSATDDIGYAMFFIYDRTGSGKIGGDTTLAGTGGEGLLNSESLGSQGGISGNIEKLDRVIVLPMPNQLIHPVAVSVDSNPMTSLLTGVQALSDYGPSSNDGAISGIIKGLGGGIAAGAAAGGSYALEKVAQTSTGAGAIVRGGLAFNDRKENFFQGVEYRQYDFTYTFTPESATEAKLIQEVVKTFRFYMLPSKVAGVFYIQPAEFLVKFYHGAAENKSVPKLSRALLRNCVVNYSPRDQWTTTQGGEGFPNEITITLSFIEKQTLFREAISEQGF